MALRPLRDPIVVWPEEADTPPPHGPQEFSATVTVQLVDGVSPQDLVRISTLASDKIDGSVAVSSDGYRMDWSVRFQGVGAPLDVTSRAYDLVSDVLREVGAGEWTVERLEALSDDERRRDAHRTSPVVGMAETGDLLGISRQRIRQLMGEGRFPEPLAELRSGPVWPRDVVAAFARQRRPAGRPRQAQERDVPVDLRD